MRRKQASGARPQYGFNSTEVARMTGASLRQLQWWDEHKLLHPAEKYGHRRGYSSEDVERIMVIMELRKRGVSIQRIRGILAKVIRETLRKPNSGREYIITDGDGRNVSCEPYAWVIPQILRTSKPVLLISLREIRDKLAGMNSQRQ
jgi:DNA-binding transcriptional MerR regulator